MSDFRSSKGPGRIETVFRKGSKYDKDSKAIGDNMVGASVKTAAQLGKLYKDQGLKRSSDEIYEGLMKGDNLRPSKKDSKGRKDFPFFKHTTKGK